VQTLKIVQFLEDSSWFYLCAFAVLSQGIVHFLEDFPILSFLGAFAALREIFLWLRLCRAKSLREILPFWLWLRRAKAMRFKFCSYPWAEPFTQTARSSTFPFFHFSIR
jgi:hypothetical protein